MLFERDIGAALKIMTSERLNLAFLSPKEDICLSFYHRQADGPIALVM